MGEPAPIAAAMVRDVLVCERRAWHDRHTDRAGAVPVTALDERLWRQDVADRDGIVGALSGVVVDLGDVPEDERAAATLAALNGSADHILNARIEQGDLLGLPDLLTRVDGRWCAGSLRFGPLHDRNGWPHWPVAAEVAFEAELLMRTGFGHGRRAFVIGVDRVVRWYDLDVALADEAPSIRQLTLQRIGRAREILAGQALTRGEVHARCGLCPWRRVCAGELADDLTQVFGIDRQVRRAVGRVAKDVVELARTERAMPMLASGVRRDEFLRLRDRARLLVGSDRAPYLHTPSPVALDRRRVHLHVVADPTRGLTVAHCLLVRDPPEEDRWECFVARDPSTEREAFAAAVWRLGAEVAAGAAVFIASADVRDAWANLRARHPGICPRPAMDRLIGTGAAMDVEVDLLEACSEWPLPSYDVPTVAAYLGRCDDDAGDDHGDHALARFESWFGTGTEEDRAALISSVRAGCAAASDVVEAVARLPVRAAPDWSTGSGAIEAKPKPNAIPVVAAASLYSRPTLRPCREIAAEPDDGSSLKMGLRDVYGPLVDELPLLGGDAMRPGTDGGIQLCDRLRATLPWMSDAIDLIERQLSVALWAGRPWIQFRPVCLVGRPGIGKSHLARELGRMACIGGATLDLGAVHDAAALVAVSRGWSNTKPCWPAQMMSAHRTANVILTLDELEKAGGSRRNGDPLTALLGMLEPSTAKAYFDTCLMAEIDLSAVCWICTANDATRIPRPLASRIDIVEVAAPKVGHVDLIVNGLMAAMAQRWGVPLGVMPELPARARRVLRDAFARDRSVRALRRRVEDLVAAMVAAPRSDLQ